MKTKDTFLFLPRGLALAGLVWLPVSADTASAAESSKPNILLLLADDVGFADTAFTHDLFMPNAADRPPEVKTPNLDRLAHEGIIFSHGYANGNGVMAVVAKGASAAQGVVVGLLPDADWRAANPYVTVPIATGLGIARNAVLARASIALVAVGGGYGTISEIALGLQFGVPVFGFFDTSPVPGVRLVRDVDEALTRVAEAILALPGGD